MTRGARIQMTLEVPWYEKRINASIVLDDGMAELLFRGRGIKRQISERERAELREEQVWRVSQVGAMLTAAILKEIEKLESQK